VSEEQEYCFKFKGVEVTIRAGKFWEAKEYWERVKKAIDAFFSEGEQ